MTTAPRYLPLLALLIVLVLTVDSVASAGVQWLLAGLVWSTLVLACRELTDEERATVVAVVVIATVGELLATQVWGRYEYRLGGLPPYVPAGHGLVYLAGLRLSQWPWARAHEWRIRLVAAAGLVGWVVVGLTSLDRVDVSGSISAVVLLGMLLLARRGLLYCGIFGAVTLLEVYGTQLGVWTWSGVVPGTNLTGGNPPSGAAATYVLCDMCAMAVAPWLLRAWRHAGPARVDVRAGSERRGTAWTSWDGSARRM